MQGKTRAQKPKLELEIETFTRKKKLVKINEVVKDVKVELVNCINVEPIVSPLLETLDVEARLEEEATPSKLSEDTPLGIETLKEEVPVEIDRKVGEDTPIFMAQEGGGMDLPPIPPVPPIDQLVRPRGLPILVL